MTASSNRILPAGHTSKKADHSRHGLSADELSLNSKVFNSEHKARSEQPGERGRGVAMLGRR